MIIDEIDIAKISKQDKEFMDKLLSNKYMNECLLDKFFLTIILHDITNDQFMYRKLFETVYMKYDRKNYSTSSYSYSDEQYVYSINISLMEAIDLIYRITPPRLSNNINDSLRSVDSIIDLLRFFISEENSTNEYAISVIQKTLHLEYFETNWMYDITAIKLLQSEYKDIDKTLIALNLYTCQSFQDIIDNNLKEKTSIQFTIYASDFKSLSEIMSIDGLMVININPKINCVVCYLSDITLVPKPLLSLIKDSYSILYK